MPLTPEQKLARQEATMARLRTKSRALHNGQKVILGGMLINAARKDPAIRDWVLREASRTITREVDRTRLAPLLDELRELS